MINFKKIIKEALTIKFDKAFGLDIGDRSVEIIELEKVFKYSISTYGRIELPAGVVENGQIINQAVLAENIKKLLKNARPKKVSTNKVVLSLPESQVFVKSFTVDAKLKSGDLNRVIIDQISLLLPINLDKTYWDFSEKILNDKNKKLIIFVAVQKEIANSYVRFCNSIGLEIISLGLESFSLARTILKSSPKQSLILDIGSLSTNLSFFDSNDKINMSVTIPLAGDHFTQEIQNKLKFGLAEAEDLKVKNGFKNDKDNIIRPVILPVLEDILKEVRQSISYYEETFNQSLEDIYLIGGSALLPDITKVIKEILGREVQIATCNYSLNFETISNRGNPFPLFANVIGLGLLGSSAGFRDINLLKKMPSAEVNSVNRLNLFNMGYLSKVNTMRTVINNKFVLIIMIILIGIIFAILLQQTKSFGPDDTPIIAPKKVNTINPKPLPKVSSTTGLVSTTTKALPMIPATTTKKK